VQAHSGHERATSTTPSRQHYKPPIRSPRTPHETSNASAGMPPANKPSAASGPKPRLRQACWCTRSAASAAAASSEPRDGTAEDELAAAVQSVRPRPEVLDDPHLHAEVPSASGTERTTSQCRPSRPCSPRSRESWPCERSRPREGGTPWCTCRRGARPARSLDPHPSRKVPATDTAS
jgi:hypothetical protein